MLRGTSTTTTLRSRGTPRSKGPKNQATVDSNLNRAALHHTGARTAAARDIGALQLHTHVCASRNHHHQVPANHAGTRRNFAGDVEIREEGSSLCYFLRVGDLDPIYRPREGAAALRDPCTQRPRLGRACSWPPPPPPGASSAPPLFSASD